MRVLREPPGLCAGAAEDRQGAGQVAVPCAGRSRRCPFTGPPAPAWQVSVVRAHGRAVLQVGFPWAEWGRGSTTSSERPTGTLWV